VDLVTAPNAGRRRRQRTRWLSAAVLLAALVLGGGIFGLTRRINDRDQQRLHTSAT